MELKLYHAAFLPVDRSEDAKPVVLSYVATSLEEVSRKVTSSDWLADHECIGIQYVQNVTAFGTVVDFE